MSNKEHTTEEEQDLVDMEIDLDNDILLEAALMAHEKNMTLNDFMVEVIEHAIAEEEKKNSNEEDSSE